jgi:hypothetical protein
MKFKTGSLRTATRLTLFACPNKVSKQRAPEALPCVAGFMQAAAQQQNTDNIMFINIINFKAVT